VPPSASGRRTRPRVNEENGTVELMDWSELTSDSRLTELLYEFLESECDDVARELATDALEEYLEEAVGYCEAEDLDGKDCNHYRAPGCGDYCEGHKGIGA
jgi:hypothetical protein